MKLRRLFARSLLLRVLGLGVSLGTTVLLTRTLAVEDYGSYVFALAIVNLLAIPVQAGLPLYIVKQTSRLDQRDNGPELLGLLHRSVQGIFLVSALALVGVVGVLAWQGEAPSRTNVLLVALPLVPLIASAQTLGSALRGFQYFGAGQFLAGILRPMLLLAFLGLAVFTGLRRTPDVEFVLWLHIAAALIAAGTAGILLVRHTRRRFGAPQKQYRTAEWLRELLPLSLIAGMSIIFGKTDIVMLRAITGLSDVAQYNVALQLGTVAIIAQHGMRMVSAPKLARLHAAGDFAGMQHVLTASARFVTLSTLPFAIAFLLFGKEILELAFGQTYVGALATAQIIIIGYILQSVFGAAESLLKMTGHERFVLYSVPVSILLNIAMNAALIPLYGAAGAAFATVVSTLAWKSYMSWSAYRKLGLLSLPFSPKIR